MYFCSRAFAKDTRNNRAQTLLKASEIHQRAVNEVNLLRQMVASTSAAPTAASTSAAPTAAASIAEEFVQSISDEDEATRVLLLVIERQTQLRRLREDQEASSKKSEE